MEDEVIDSTVEEVVQPDAVQEEPVQKSMDDTIRDTLAAIESRGEETEEQREERLRDEKGRFAKAAAPEQPVEQATPAAEAPEAAPAVPQELQRLGLRKEEAEAFQQAPKVLQDAFLRRSEEMHRGLEQFRTKAQFGHAFEQVAAPYAATFQQYGIHPAQAFERLMAAESVLRNGSPDQKRAAFVKMATDYGIDLGQVQDQLAVQPMADPQVAQLQAQLQQMQSWIQQQNQRGEWEERERLNSQISSFAQDPANIYFNQVRDTMAGLLQAGLATDLKDAYEKAIYANPEIRPQLLAKQQAEALEKAKRDAAQKAQAARQSAAVNLTRRGVAPAAKPVGSMEDTIRETAQRLGIM